ncbi:hypothetical protein [Kordiimonas laminariae]|uniref:hypothetical protein n=1 Tax=Kordiimonas laminariae TaxID=2917717 RepID=UPI001FF51691|nr:hypothetical protein [Kordiimonas laminariae]MCK0068359.1 hypothetical protein [Kordiimonas laminariae]
MMGMDLQKINIVLYRKPLRRFLGTIVQGCMLGIILGIFPFENFIEYDFSGWGNVQYLYAGALFVVFLGILYGFIIHTCFAHIRISSRGVFRFGVGGIIKIFESQEIRMMEWHAEGLLLVQNNGRKYLFPATHYNSP